MPLSYTDIKHFSIARAHGVALAETDVTTTPANAAYDAERMSLDRALGIALSGDAAHASMGEDHLGNGRFAYNQAKTQTAAFEHYPYGARYTTTGTAPYHEFTGKPWDPDASLFYFPYRCLRPDMARWTSADPLGLVDGSNVYGYVRNCPNKHADPLGLTILKPAGLLCNKNCSQSQIEDVTNVPEGDWKKYPESPPTEGQCIETDGVSSDKGRLKIPGGWKCTMICDEFGRKLSCRCYTFFCDPRGPRKPPDDSRWPNNPHGPNTPLPGL